MYNRFAIGPFIGIVLLISFSSYGLLQWWESSSGKLPFYGKDITGTNSPHQINRFQLTNQQRNITGTDLWKNKIVVVNFFFTHCAGICPKMTNNLKKIQEVFQNDTGVVINSLTVDPERDSSSQLKSYAEKFGINNNKWQLLTGDKKEIYRLARNDFMIVATDGDGGPNDFIHSEKLVLVDPLKRIRGYYDGTDKEEVEQLINDIKKLKDEN